MEYIRIFENNVFEFIPVAGYVIVKCPIDNRRFRVPYNLTSPESAWICDNGNGSSQCKSCVSSVSEGLRKKVKLSAAQEPQSP